MPGSEGGRCGKELEFGRQLEGIQLEEGVGHGGDLRLHLHRADDLEKTALAFDSERSHSSGLNRATLATEGFLEGDQERVGTDHRLVQRDEEGFFVLAKGADILPVGGDIAEIGRDRDRQFRDRSSGDEIVDEDTSVGGAFAERVEVKDVGLDALGEDFDTHRCRPVLLPNPKGLLETGNLLREIREGFLDEQLGLGDSDAEAGLGNDPDVSSDRLRIGMLDAGKDPVTRLGGGAQLPLQGDELASTDIGVENDLQRTLAIDRLRPDDIIGDRGSTDGDDGVAFGIEEVPFADGGFPDVEFELALDDSVGVGKSIEQDLGNRGFGLNPVGGDLVSIFRRGKTIDENLAGGDLSVGILIG